MKVRTRLAILLALAMLVLGTSMALISALTYQQAVYTSPTSFSSALYKSLGVTRQQVVDYLRLHPEAAIDPRSVPGGSATQRKINNAFQAVQRRVQRNAVNRARLWTIAFVAVLSIVTALIGWVIAGNMLRPLRLIASRARSASAANLTDRVALGGPDDELTQLADTFDEMLDRLEQSFSAQRRFSAQVSHELRSPLAIVRNEVELLLPDVNDAVIASSLHTIREAGLRAERLVTALLVLARSESGNLQLRPVSLDEIVGVAVGELVEAESFRALRVDLDLESVAVVGDESLLESLVRNLVDNAARHNRPNGWVRIRVAGVDANGERRGLLEIENSTRSSVGAGSDDVGVAETNTGNQIGRTVVQSIVDAHLGAVEWHSNDDGVVLVRVSLPGGSPAPVAGLDAANVVDSPAANAHLT